MQRLYKLSIVIPTYNDAPSLDKTLSSLLNLKFVEDLDIIIIDGDSKDDTMAVAAKYSNIINHMSSTADEGEYDAMNKGIDVCSSEFILFLMAGDCIYSHVGVTKIENIAGPCFVPVYRLRDNNGLQKLSQKPSSLFGLPHCHQGIVFKRPLPYFDLKYKISADYKHFLKSGYSSKLPMISQNFYVVYDEGHSGRNYIERDLEIYEISRIHFGVFLSLFVLIWIKIKHFIKQFFLV